MKSPRQFKQDLLFKDLYFWDSQGSVGQGSRHQDSKVNETIKTIIVI